MEEGREEKRGRQVECGWYIMRERKEKNKRIEWRKEKLVWSERMCGETRVWCIM